MTRLVQEDLKPAGNPVILSQLLAVQTMHNWILERRFEGNRRGKENLNTRCEIRDIAAGKVISNPVLYFFRIYRRPMKSFTGWMVHDVVLARMDF